MENKKEKSVSYLYERALDLVKVNHKKCGCGHIHRVIPKQHQVTTDFMCVAIWFDCKHDGCGSTLMVNCNKLVENAG